MQHKSLNIYLILVILLFVQNICTADQFLKCTDSKGNVYFTDSKCPEAKTVTEEVIDIQSSTKPRDTRYDFLLPQNQVRRMEEQRASENARRQYRRQHASKPYEQTINKKEAEKLREEAQELYEEAATKRTMLKSRRRALQEQAQSLERQADILLGRRETLAPTKSEQTERRLQEIEGELNSPQYVPYSPQYVPSIKKWCQQQGGVMNCW